MMRSSRIPKKVRTLNNPVIAHHYPDLCDFGKFRDVNWIEVDQIWALYDDHDFMPRVYARIDHIDTSSLKVQFTWLAGAQSYECARGEMDWSRIACCSPKLLFRRNMHCRRVTELDTSAHLPSELDSTFLSIAVNHYMSLNTRQNTEFTSCVYPVFEFHKSGHVISLNMNKFGHCTVTMISSPISISG